MYYLNHLSLTFRNLESNISRILFFCLSYPMVCMTCFMLPSIDRDSHLYITDFSSRTSKCPRSNYHINEPIISWYHCNILYLIYPVLSISVRYPCLRGVMNFEGSLGPFLPIFYPTLFTMASQYLLDDMVQNSPPWMLPILEICALRYVSGSSTLSYFRLKFICMPFNTLGIMTDRKHVVNIVYYQPGSAWNWT